MKKYFFSLFIFLVHFIFLNATERKVCIYGLLSLKQTVLLDKIQKDTLLFSRVDTLYKSKLEWGIFYPNRKTAIFFQNSYNRVLFNDNIISVYTNDFKTEPYQVEPYVSNPFLFKWSFVSFFMSIYFFTFLFLRRLIFYLYRDNRYVKKNKIKIETIISVLITVILTAAIGYFIRSFLFLSLSFCYFAFLFIPSKKWYSSLDEF